MRLLTLRTIARSTRSGIRHGSWERHGPLPPPSATRNTFELIPHRILRVEHETPATYRSTFTPGRWVYRWAQFFGAFFWTWMLLGFWYEPEHVFGHYEWPDATKWTNKELGIPSELPDEA